MNKREIPLFNPISFEYQVKLFWIDIGGLVDNSLLFRVCVGEFLFDYRVYASQLVGVVVRAGDLGFGVGVGDGGGEVGAAVGGADAFFHAGLGTVAVEVGVLGGDVVGVGDAA